MTTPDLTALDNTLEEIRVSEIVDRIVELERRAAACEAEGEPFADDDAAELKELIDLEGQLPPRARSIVRHDAPTPWAGCRLVAFAGVTYWVRRP